MQGGRKQEARGRCSSWFPWGGNRLKGGVLWIVFLACRVSGVHSVTCLCEEKSVKIRLKERLLG